MRIGKKVFFLLALTHWCGHSPCLANTERFVEGQFAFLESAHQTAIEQVPRQAPERDVIIACINLVSEEWFTAYLRVIRHSSLSLTELEGSLQPFGEFLASVRADLRGMDIVRSNMSNIIKTEIRSRRYGRKASWPKGAQVTEFSLTQIQSDLLAKNYVECLDGNLPQSLTSSIPKPNLSALGQHKYFLEKAIWKQSSAGGIEVSFQANETLSNAVSK